MRLSEHISILGRAIKFVYRLDKIYVYCIIFGTILSAIIPYVPIYYSARLVDALYIEATVPRLLMYVVLTVGIVFLLKLMETYISFLQDKAINAMCRKEEWQYSEKAMEMAYETTEDRNVTLLRGQIKKETQIGYNRWYLYVCIRDFCKFITEIICSIALTGSFFFLDAVPDYMKLGLITLLVLTIVVSGMTTAKSQKNLNNFYAGCVFANTFLERYIEYVNDYTAGQDIRLYAMGDCLARSGAKVICEFFQKHIRVAKKNTCLSFVVVFMNQALKYVTYLALIMGAIAGEILVGSIAKYVSCIMKMLTAISGLVKTIQLAATNNIYMKRYFSYFDIPNNMYQGTLTVEKRDDVEYYVEFRDVSFKYPNTDTYALRHVNMKFKIGEKLAVVGMNGSGKTTFIKLLCRLYDPLEGEILLNGVNIKKYDYDEYMSIFSIVFQDFSLLDFSLGQNVAASRNYEKERVIACLKKVGLSEFYDKLPKGTESYLGKGYDKEGIEISGGEAQKIALARALYKDAPFIVLDEPTAALDPVSEYEVYSKFNEIAGEKTTLYISHRLASCRFCDAILVFDYGSIVQQGSHEELLEDTAGKYFELWNAQAQYYTA